ncbi:YdgH/BhsA/McbA-like domain containing protein [Klebsiella sp. WOUb02]|uniref:YdgH/BhsA/McbA-like domain containing protein n=1 Tax=Klebsiella sp. WOUb02 TaxID=3161071 RepID=UPI003CECB635
MMKILVSALFILILPFSVFAKTVTATGDTLEHAENKIRQLTKQQGGETYKIIEARMGNKVHITAKITS